MRPSRSVTTRASIVTLGLIMAALAISLWPRVAVNAGSVSAVIPAPSGCVPVSSTVCWYTETVDYNANDFNYITGITNGEHIVGAYSTTNAANSVFNSFYVPPSPAPTTYPSPFTSNNAPGFTSTFLQGISNSGYKVGYGQQCSSCATVGVLRINVGTTAVWKTIQDPNNGTCTGTMRVTKIMAMNETEQGVGWYNKLNTSGQCEPQAFEFYPKDSNNFEYHDLSPTVSGQTVLYSTANGINTLGDVVGAVTYGSLANPHTAGWLYSELRYYTFQYPSHDTYANGVNYNDGVVGDYTTGSGNNMATHGFVVVNPANTTNPFTVLDLSSANPPLTVIRSINTDWFITGWYLQGGNYHGFVGDCQVTMPHTCPNSSSSAQKKRPTRKPRGALLYQSSRQLNGNG